MSKEQAQGALRLWRIWRLTEKNELQALLTEHTWQRGKNSILSKDAMDDNKTGFYGFDHLKRIPEQEGQKYRSWLRGTDSPMVIGSILGWGRALIGPWGARVQYAQPEYLVLTGKDFDYDLRLQETAVKYAMECCTWDQALTLYTGYVRFREDMIK